MPLSVIHFKCHGRAQWRVVRDGRTTPVSGEFPTTSLSPLDGLHIDAGDVELLTPVTRNRQPVCQRANYRQHMIESGMNPGAKKFNMIFTMAPGCIAPVVEER